MTTREDVWLAVYVAALKHYSRRRSWPPQTDAKADADVAVKAFDERFPERHPVTVMDMQRSMRKER